MGRVNTFLGQPRTVASQQAGEDVDVVPEARAGSHHSLCVVRGLAHIPILNGCVECDRVLGQPDLTAIVKRSMCVLADIQAYERLCG